MNASNLLNTPWTRREDEALRMYRRMGLTFGEIAEHMVGRTPKSCKARFAKIIVFDGAPSERPIMVREDGSAKLLRRQLQTGQHFIKDPALFRERCLEVGLCA